MHHAMTFHVISIDGKYLRHPTTYDALRSTLLTSCLCMAFIALVWELAMRSGVSGGQWAHSGWDKKLDGHRLWSKVRVGGNMGQCQVSFVRDFRPQGDESFEEGDRSRPRAQLTQPTARVSAASEGVGFSARALPFLSGRLRGPPRRPRQI